MILNRFKLCISFLLIALSCNSQNENSPQNNVAANQTFAVCDKVETEQRFAGNADPDSSASLPFGIIKEIGPTRYIIAIDSAKFGTSSARFSAYMALEFPGTGQKIAFAAKNIAFNPKGVMASNNTRLQLVSEHHIKISSNITLVLIPDGRNYIEWDCNGFKSVNLKGYFKISGGLVIPDVESTTDSVVTASFEINTVDLHNMVCAVSITPFCLKSMKNISFAVNNAVVDWSEISNSPGMTFPEGYQHPFPTDQQMWTGFYIKQFTIKLPKEISKSSGRTSVQAFNFVLDKTGVSGNFQVNNLFQLNEGDLSGWNFSIDKLGLNIANNHLNGGNIAGTIELPILKDNGLQFSATVFENPESKETDYSFTISPKNNIKFNMLSAKIDLLPTSKITVTKIAGKLVPLADLNGSIGFNSSNAKTGKLSFQEFIINNEAPYMQSGIFNFTTSNPDSNKTANYPVSINNITLIIHPQHPGVAFTVGLSFMQDTAQGFSAAVTVGFLAKIAPDFNGKTEVKFDRVKIYDVSLEVKTTSFYLNGKIIFKDDDPVYGKGFFGHLAFMIEGVLTSPAEVNLWLGKKDDFKYFYVDATIPYQVPIGYGLALYRFMGGLYYHMKQPGNGANLASNLYSPIFGNAQTYIPDKTAGLGFKGGVTIGIMGDPTPFNGDVALEVLFNSTGGLSFIKMTGDVFFMTDIPERMSKPISAIPIHGYMMMMYDFDNKIFHALMGIDIHYGSVIGAGQTVIHRDEKDWYLHIGKPANRASITAPGIGNLGGYFMVGNKVDPMPMLPTEVTSVLGSQYGGDQRSATDLASGKRFVFGVESRTSAQKNFGFDFFSVYGNFYLVSGFDAMISKYNNPICPTNGAKAGFNSWYMKGQAYAAFQGNIGIQGSLEVAGISKNFDITLFSAAAAAILQVEMPQPNYMSGNMACNYNILGIINGNFNYNFELGQRCGI